MINVHAGGRRGCLDNGWLKSFHTFSFGEYYDPDNMGYRILRVLNEDHVQPGQGFKTHSHRDMEILSFILEGELYHKDDAGNDGVMKSGGVQYLSAGLGIEHSESNPSTENEACFLQIWILPRDRNLLPHYAQRHFEEAEKQNRFRLIVSEDGLDDSLPIRQDVKVYSSILKEKQHSVFLTHQQRYYWLHVAKGSLMVNNHRLEKGDGASISGEQQLDFIVEDNDEETEFLLFDLP